jgi:hypothetical protein
VFTAKMHNSRPVLCANVSENYMGGAFLFFLEKCYFFNLFQLHSYEILLQVVPALTNSYSWRESVKTATVFNKCNVIIGGYVPKQLKNGPKKLEVNSFIA